MIGKVLSVDGTTINVDCPTEYPGQELACRSITQRLAPATFALYQAGDEVLVMEVEDNEFIVMGIYK